jgi:aminopeptidase N
MIASLALCSPASAQFSPGARSAGDPYLPHVGNGGYDAQHYDLTLSYNPTAHFLDATVKATLRATQGLSEFSLDFKNFNIASVKVNGVEATYVRDIDADVSNPKYKLVVTPAAGIPNGSTFEVEVVYSGTPENFLDPDGTFEGFLRTTTSPGAFVVNEPIGAMGWFPSNNHPGDKATYDFHITAPADYSTAGNGELTGPPTVNRDATKTWNWHMGYPMASYLSTASVGKYDYYEYAGGTATGKSGHPLKLYDYIETALPAATKQSNETQRLRQDAIVKFMADSIGAPYPFESHGVVAHRSPAGYALEVQTKSHFGSGSISAGTLAHEIAHQWFGDSVGPASWREIWFNEGWATWWAQYWGFVKNNSPTSPAAAFIANYNGTAASLWNTPPAELPGPENLFDPTFPPYTRPSMMIEAYRQIVGESAFWAFAKALVTEYAYSTINEAQFIALAKRIAAEKAGFEASNLRKLDLFFQQWLHLRGRPTLTPTTFFQSTSVDGVVTGTVPATLALTMGAPVDFGNFVPGVAKTYGASTTATVVSTAGDATLSVVDPSPNVPGHLVNGAFSLASALKVKAGAAAFADVSGTPLTLKAYDAPVSNDMVPIDFQQAIGANEPLRTGTYGKTLTYALSTTNP